jgi:hypothetical protein
LGRHERWRARALFLAILFGLIGGSGCIFLQDPPRRLPAGEVFQDPERHWRELRMRYEADAFRGELRAKTRLGRMYLEGRPGLAADRKKGMALLEEAAGRHDAFAELLLGQALFANQGASAAERMRAIELLKRAASYSCLYGPYQEDLPWLGSHEVLLDALRQLGTSGKNDALLWNLRAVAHCKLRGDERIIPVRNTAPVSQLAWFLFAQDESRAAFVAATMSPEDKALARQRVDGWRKLVADSEIQFPRPSTGYK